MAILPQTTSAIPWSDDLTASSLQLLADTIVELSGFELACVSVVSEDHLLHSVGVSGDDEARAYLQLHPSPMSVVEEALASGEDWGRFRFTPADRSETSLVAEPGWWVPQIEVSDDEDAWHPLDLLMAPLHDRKGRLRGTVAIDAPRDGRRPGPEQRELLERCAEHAERVFLAALERERLTRQVQLAQVARRVIRDASQHDSDRGVLEAASQAMIDCFGLDVVWTRMLNQPDVPQRAIWRDRRELPPDPTLEPYARAAGQRMWAAQETILVSGAEMRNVVEHAAARRTVAYLREQGLDSVLLVPVGAGETCLGSLALGRPIGAPAWTRAECTAALEICRDLGRVLFNSRALRREREVVRDLQAVDSYRSALVRTVSHELKNPLASIVANLELLGDPDLGADATARAVANLGRGADRMARVLGDLTSYSEAGEADKPVVREPVDLVPIVRDVCDLTAQAARQRGLSVHVRAPLGAVTVLGDASLLDRVIINLLNNAVKYTPDGGRITVTVATDGDEVELTVEDNGIGISDDDQRLLFREFFRSDNPQALRQPGTGLGLAIVDRIVQRHGGRIEVDSELGTGSTFRVFLRAAP